jgi:hypothetical protein
MQSPTHHYVPTPDDGPNPKPNNHKRNNIPTFYPLTIDKLSSFTHNITMVVRLYTNYFAKAHPLNNEMYR